MKKKLILLALLAMYLYPINSKKINFNLKKESLLNLIEKISRDKKINVILPQGASSIPPNLNVTFKPLEEYISIENAWKYLKLMLDIAGFTIIPSNNNYKVIKKTISNKENLPIYIQNQDLLPDGDEKIRYFYSFLNINIKKYHSDIASILTEMLSQKSNIKIDINSNAILITDFANHIKSAMKIIYELDKSGFRESIEIIPIRHTTPNYIAEVFNKLQKEDKNTQFRYFSEKIKIIPLERINSLIIMGNIQDIEKVKNFIIKYLDNKINNKEGKLIHLYDLNYLNPEEIKNILNNIIKKEQIEEHSKGQNTRFKDIFENIIIETEIQKKENEVLSGGNRLIIIAKKNDWKKIKKLIRTLDTPQSQIAIESMLIDISLDSFKSLGSQTRELRNAPGKNQRWQTANLDNPILDDTPSIAKESPEILIPHLLRKIQGSDSEINIANKSTPGATILSLRDSDGSAWSIIQSLKRYSKLKIISEPFVVTKNNNPAIIKSTKEVWKKQGPATILDTTSIQISYESFPASYQIKVTPTISDESKNINISADVLIEDFKSDKANSKITRNIKTNANVKDGDILIIGGLIETYDKNYYTGIPIISKIPILGWITKKKNKSLGKSLLMIFIRPKIIPKGKTINSFTKKKLKIIDKAQTNFTNLRDPITRWFFEEPAKKSHSETMERFLNPTTNKKKYINTNPIPKKDIKEKIEKLKHLLKA